MKVGYLAIGHHGTVHRLIGTARGPRAQLLEACYRKSARKIYVDTKAGEQKHVGYIVGGEWFDVYEVHEWAGKAE